MSGLCKLTLTKARGFYTYFCLDVFIVEDRGLVAQLVEQYTFNVRVDGSNPSGLTSFITERSFLFGSPSSSGPGHHPFTVATRVRISLGTLLHRHTLRISASSRRATPSEYHMYTSVLALALP